MKKCIITAFTVTHLFFCAFAQDHSKIPDKLKVFIDCSDTGCDMTFIRTEINLVDFMLDRVAADVHVLITEQSTGSGGSKYQLIFFGQNRFKNLQDTLQFNTDANATDFEERDLLIKYIKLGLAPAIAKTGAAKDAVISLKRVESASGHKDSSATSTKDPWNYWVYRVSVNGYYRTDENYRNSSSNGELSVNRVTEELKTGFEVSGGKSKEIYFDEPDSLGYRPKTINKNDNYRFQHFLVKSINDHWSYGYQVGFSRSTFSNNKHQAILQTGIEYAIFPYKQVNTKFFTVSYILDVRRNAYVDTTLYDKAKETLFGQGVESKFSYKQKWGSIFFSLEYHNYLQNWKYFSLGANLELDIRITGGLSFNLNSFAELTRDQLFLPRAGASFTDILIRRRQLASGYNFYTSFGINYRFGSKLNNFVNPRFD
jgi:hypothetical protein